MSFLANFQNYRSFDRKFYTEKLQFFLDRRKDNFDSEFPTELSFLANFQNYRKQLTNSPFDRKFYTEKL